MGISLPVLLVLVLVVPGVKESQLQGGIKHFTFWELIHSAKNFARNRGSCKIAVISYKKFLTVAWDSFLWQEVSFCDKKFLLMPRYFFLWQEIFSVDNKFLIVAWNSFLRQRSIHPSEYLKSDQYFNSYSYLYSKVWFWALNDWFKGKPYFKTCWWSMCNENSIYKNWNYDHMPPQFGPLCIVHLLFCTWDSILDTL